MPGIKLGLHTKETLKNVLTDVVKVVDKLNALVESMGNASVEQIEIGYHTEALKALRKINDFADYGLSSLEETRKQRGDYGVETGEKQSPKKPRKKAKPKD